MRQFHPPHWSHLGRLNNRTRRKLLIVDGRVGLTCGVETAPPWTGGGHDPARRRDTHFQVEGPVVAQMQRGVKLRIVAPGQHIDSETVRKASRATWGPQLAAGAVIAEYGPTMYHCKVMIVDGMLVSVGSTNFDNRSFRLNDEATLNVVNEAFANAQTATIEADRCGREPSRLHRVLRRGDCVKCTAQDRRSLLEPRCSLPACLLNPERGPCRR